MPLNPHQIPLNQICLIEASAGTGKTYTIGSLYLRLLLQANEQSEPLRVEQILVVTFTEMATQELKQRIRERIYQAKQGFMQYKLQGQDFLAQLSDPFLAELIATVSDVDEAIHRLTIAEQTMDLAAIYTIHGFCRRMLEQYAFHSGIHLNLTLVQDESELLQQLVRDIWRQQFYSQPFVVANYIHDTLKSPKEVAARLRPYVHQYDLKISTNQPHLLQLSFAQCLQQLAQQLENVEQIKQQLQQMWLQYNDEIQQLIWTELDKKYARGEKKRLKRHSFSRTHVVKRFHDIEQWAKGEKTKVPDQLANYFSQQNLNSYAEEGAEPICHPVFEKVDEWIEIQQQINIDENILLYHYWQSVKTQLLQHKLNHSDKHFDDLLYLLNQALHSAQGEVLSQFIRHQYPFAMIDEFQDTNLIQYQIFAQIYLHAESQSPRGLMMIGDPKQAIYKFRGADIFTYFHAAQQAEQRFTLDKNWRSQANLVQAVNQLFDFNTPAPFIYDQIDFLPVKAKANQAQFILNGNIEPAMRFYLSDTHDDGKMADACAISIQQWLKSAVENQAVFATEKDPKVVKAENIAVLVSSRTEAQKVKQALQKYGIASVYLSDKSNVFDRPEAKELALILSACLNPLSERHILKAIATTLFALTSQDIQHLKQDESHWEKWVENFLEYQKFWQQKGILVMLHQLFLKEQIIAKWLSQPQGERLVTDLLHMAELLQKASQLNDTQASLLRWFEKQLHHEQRDAAEEKNAQQIRLESERQLVKIVTVHKSKGLEYDLVWLPFISKKMPSIKNKDIHIYYSEKDQQNQWDLHHQHQDLVRQEQWAEQVRLLYVALTRAKYQIVMALPEQLQQDNALSYVLTQGQMASNPNTADWLNQFQQKLATLGVSIAIQNIDELKASQPLTLSVEAENLQAAQFSGNIEQNWQVTSFSHLAYLHQQKTAYLNQEESAVDFVTKEKSDFELSTALANKTPLNYTALYFPRGAKVGTELHHYFEKYAFNQGVNLEGVEKICANLALTTEWQQPLTQWIEQILSTPLLDNSDFCLNQLAPQDCLKEMQFYLKLSKSFNAEKFNQLLKRDHCLPVQPINIYDIKGMLRGFIDLVFRHQGKYYILDYKSNFLGENQQDYQQDKLNQAMLEHHYDWQYLFYTLALHRYLTQRVQGYQYEQHFGGVIYGFLRGMNGQAQQGVFFDKPKAELITKLGELF